MEYRAKVKEMEFEYNGDMLKYKLPGETCVFIGKDETVSSSEVFIFRFEDGTEIGLNQQYIDKYFEPIEDHKENSCVYTWIEDFLWECSNCREQWPVTNKTYYCQTCGFKITKGIIESLDELVEKI